MEAFGLLALLGLVCILVFIRRRAVKSNTPPPGLGDVGGDGDDLVHLPAPEPRVSVYDAAPTSIVPAPSHDLVPAAPRQLVGRAYVVDGDTITVKGVRLRLYGIDAPELDHPYGKVARSAMIRLCKGQEVTAEIRDEDVHGRTVARCVLSDGRDLSAELVKMGLALDWPKYSDGAYKHLEVADVRRKLWLADARQKGRMDVWNRFEAKRKAKAQVD